MKDSGLGRSFEVQKLSPISDKLICNDPVRNVPVKQFSVHGVVCKARVYGSGEKSRRVRAEYVVNRASSGRCIRGSAAEERSSGICQGLCTSPVTKHM
jgi:hypothetical protein